MPVTVERTISVTGRGERVIRIPSTWHDPGFAKGRTVRLVYDGTTILVEPIAGAAP